MELYKAKYSDKKFNKYSKSNQTSNKYSRNDEPKRSYRNSRDEGSTQNRSHYERKSEMHNATCSDCGDKCQIPFEPKFNRPIYCSECFQKNKFVQFGNKYSKNTKPLQERYFRDEINSSNQVNSVTNKSKNNKFLKKTKNFYSNGSEKFYSSLKEKLFEILGGKTCSICGFKDERALGFNHIHDENAFDSIRRGGFASSWGKYISEPELARKDLRVLCLNCNEILQPQTKLKPKNSKNPIKKSHYFPR